MIGLTEGETIRLKSVGTGKYLRVRDAVDALGGNGPVPFMEVRGGRLSY